ncbi:MAG TPA: YihY/virulence factor BrkB family protein [Acidimicrobiales bacterium]|nr:YihY/virulence factor BrkB family protein [Acidimicrobiales bacterium]
MERLRALAERWPWLGTALTVHQRVGETNGGATASAATVMFFVAVFPLVLVAIAVVGFLASGDATVSDDIVDGLGLSGQAAEQVRDAIATAQDSRRAASIVGVAGLLWSSLGVTTAVALAVRTPWQRKVEGLRSKLVGLVWLLGGAVTFAGAVGAGALLNHTPEAVPRPVTSAALVALGLALELAFFLWTFWILGDRRAGWQALLPGTVAGALGLEVLKLAATVAVPRMVASSSSLYGPLGVVFAILAWLTLFSRLIVYASALNAVRWEEDHGVTTLEIKAPRFEGEVPVEADRGGAVAPVPDHPEGD